MPAPRKYTTRKLPTPDLAKEYSIERCQEILAEDPASCDDFYFTIQRAVRKGVAEWTEGRGRRAAARARAKSVLASSLPTQPTGRP